VWDSGGPAPRHREAEVTVDVRRGPTPGPTQLVRAGGRVQSMTIRTGDRPAGPPALGTRQLESVLASVTADVDGHLSSRGGAGHPIPHERTARGTVRELPVRPHPFTGRWELCARCGDERPHRGHRGCRTSDPDTEAVSIWGARYAASLAGRVPRVWVSPRRPGWSSCRGRPPGPSLRHSPRLAARRSCRDADLAKVIDPRAVDARSAALGRYQPPSRRV